MRVCFYTLGCKVNLNETGALEQMFRGAGFTIVPEGEEADVFVVNSCTVTNFGDQKSRKWLRRAKRENPGAVTVLTGCYPQAFPEEAAEIAEADVVTGSGNRRAILADVQKVLDGEDLRENMMSMLRTLVESNVSTALSDNGGIADEAGLKDWYRRFGFAETQTRDFPHLPFLVSFMHCPLR